MKKTTRRTFSAKRFLNWYKNYAKNPEKLNAAAVIREGRAAYNEGRERFEMRGYEAADGLPACFDFKYN